MELLIAVDDEIRSRGEDLELVEMIDRVGNLTARLRKSLRRATTNFGVGLPGTSISRLTIAMWLPSSAAPVSSTQSSSRREVLLPVRWMGVRETSISSVPLLEDLQLCHCRNRGR